MRVTLKSLVTGILLVAVTVAWSTPARAQQPVAPGSSIVALPPVPMAQFAAWQARSRPSVVFARPLPPPPVAPARINPRLPQAPLTSREAQRAPTRPITPTEERVFIGITLAIFGLVILTHKPL